MRHARFAGASLVLVCSTLSALATPARLPGVPPAAPPAPPSAAVRPPAPRPRPAAKPPRPKPTVKAPRPTPEPPRLTASSLYARRTMRLVRSYLRLKLLETREADLERARKVVERKLGIKALLGETPPPDGR